MKTKTISSDQARAKWREMLDTAVTGDHVIIERYGKPVAVLLPYQDYVRSGVVREETAVYQTKDWNTLKAELTAEIRANLLARPDIQQALLRAELAQLQKHEQAHLEEEFADYEQRDALKTELTAEIKAELLAGAESDDNWVGQLQQLRQRIAETGGIMTGLTKEEIVEQLRRTRQEIFEAEYAHLY